MNSKTKIVVIHMKELVIGGIILLVAIIAAVAIIINLVGGNNHAESSSSQNSSTTNNTSQINKNNTNNINNKPETTTNTNNSQTTNTTNVTPTYTPGVYTASVSLEGNPVDIQVTVDKNNINSIELVQVSDTVTTMYPLIQTNFEEIATMVMKNGSTENITLGSDNKYTSTMLLNAIQKALDKCVVK